MSLDRLEEILSPLANGRRRGDDPGIDWSAVERALGTTLPPDFVALSIAYPPFTLSDFLAVHCVTPGCEDDFVSGLEEDWENLDDLRRNGMAHGFVPYPEPNGLIPWGDSAEGDLFFWKTCGKGPVEWTVVVAGRNDDWVEYRGSMTEYLAGLVSGEVVPDGLPLDFPGADPAVEFD